MNTKIISWVVRIAASLIYLQTLFFKFTGAPEAVATFRALGVEPWGRIATGVLELIAAVLMLVPRTAHLGLALGFAVILGAIASHLGPLGIAPGGDPTLFVLALIVLACTGIGLWLYRKQLPIIGARFQ